MKKEYENTEETAKRLGVSKSWIWDRARRGEIPCAKVGKYYFFRRTEVDSWISKHSQTEH